MGIGLFDDQLDSNTAYSPRSESSLISQPSSGIGIAPVAPPTLLSPRRATTSDIEKMSGLGKVSLMLESFGAGVMGKPHPIDAMIKQKREERLSQMQEFRVHLASLEDGIKMSERLRDPDREAFANSYAARLDELSPGLGDTFKALHKRPDITKMLGKYADIPMAQVSLAGDPTGQSFLKLLGSAEGMKMAEKQLDMKALPVVTQKVKIIAQNWQQLVPKEMIDKFNEDGVLSESEILKANGFIRDKYPKLALDDSQLEVLRRNSNDVFRPLGIVTAVTEQDVIKKRLESKEKLQPGQIVDIPLGGKNFAKGAYDPDKTLFPAAEHDANGFAILGKGTKEGTTITFPSSTGFGVDPTTGKPGHFTISKDGELRWDKVEPLPKDKSPLRKIIEDTLEGGTNPNRANLISEAKAAIAKGANRAAVKKRLEEMGVKNHGL